MPIPKPREKLLTLA